MNILIDQNIHYKVIDNINEINSDTQFHKFIKISNKVKYPILPGQIPHGVIGIIFGSNMNHEINKKNLPSTLKILYLGFNFNQDLNDLPDGLEELTLGSNFQGTIKNVSNLKKLTIKSNYNKRLPYLPHTKIYMYNNNIGDQVFKDYVITMKKSKDKKNYINNENLLVIRIREYKTYSTCCKLWFLNLFNCY